MTSKILNLKGFTIDELLDIALPNEALIVMIGKTLVTEGSS